VGHIIQANGGRLKNQPGRGGVGVGGEGLAWVSDLTTERRKSEANPKTLNPAKSEARNLRQSASYLRSAVPLAPHTGNRGIRRPYFGELKELSEIRGNSCCSLKFFNVIYI